MSDDVGERIARLEGELEGMEALIRQRLRGYLDAEIKSLLHGQHASDAVLQRQIDTIRISVHGRDGSNGMASKVKILGYIIWAQWAILASLVGTVFGLKLPL